MGQWSDVMTEDCVRRPQYGRRPRERIEVKQRPGRTSPWHVAKGTAKRSTPDMQQLKPPNDASNQSGWWLSGRDVPIIYAAYRKIRGFEQISPDKIFARAIMDREREIDIDSIGEQLPVSIRHGLQWHSVRGMRDLRSTRDV